MTNHYLVIDDWWYWFINPNMLNRERAEHQKPRADPELDRRPAHRRSARIAIASMLTAPLLVRATCGSLGGSFDAAETAGSERSGASDGDGRDRQRDRRVRSIAELTEPSVTPLEASTPGRKQKPPEFAGSSASSKQWCGRAYARSGNHAVRDRVRDCRFIRRPGVSARRRRPLLVVPGQPRTLLCPAALRTAACGVHRTASSKPVKVQWRDAVRSARKQRGCARGWPRLPA
jgi:hypothetical protein